MANGAALVALSRLRATWALSALVLAPCSVAAQRVALLPVPGCAAHAVVPPLAPDSVSEDVLDSLGTVTGASRPDVQYMKNLIVALFDSTASLPQRQAAVDRVCGTVVGGDRSGPGTDGYYLVRLRGAESVEALDAAADAVRRMPGVASAQTLALHRADAAEPPPNGRSAPMSVCADGSSGGWLRIDAVKEMLASRDTDEQTLMADIGLAGVDSSAIRVVNDAAVCGRVASAIELGTHMPPLGSPYLVLRAGPRYVAFDPRGFDRSFFLVDTGFVFRTVLR